MYQFQLGSRVVHKDYPNINGIITELLTIYDETGGCPKDGLDDENPWYHIRWLNDPDVGEFIGFEFEGSLRPDPSPTH